MARLTPRRWAFLGCVAHEERCLSTLSALADFSISPTLVRIFDADPIDGQKERDSLDAQAKVAALIGNSSCNIVDTSLLATIDTIEDIVNNCCDGFDSLIIDISSLPKRWFFVITRLVRENNNLSNIIFTYALGGKYADVLSSNPEIIRTIPTFTSMERRSVCDVAFVGIGFHSQSVLNLFDVERPRSVSMLFPFPPGPPGISKNWRFVEKLELSIRAEEANALDADSAGVRHLHVGALDVPQNFNALKKLTADGTKTSLVAPYGPKPVSLAMCLFSLAAEAAGKAEVPAYYSQPTRYSLDYTTGTANNDGNSVIFAYPIRLNSRDYYTL